MPTIPSERPQISYFIMDSIFKLTIGHQIKMAWISESWSTYSLTMQSRDNLGILSRFLETLLKSIFSYVQNAGLQ